jgi:hypothetical protein
MLSPLGLNAQVEYEGSIPHCSVNAPCEPLSGVITSVYSAVWPLAMVVLDVSENVTVKSKPVPESGTVTPAASALLDTVSVPLCTPVLAAAGANSTPTVQLLPATSVEAQVLFTN